MHFLQIFHLFLKCVIYFTTLESVCQDFFQTFSKSFLRFSWTCNPEINLCFTHFLLFSWLKNRLNTGFLKPLLFKFFAALSRQLVYNIITAPKCQHIFSDFLNFFFKKFLHTKYSLLNNLSTENMVYKQSKKEEQSFQRFAWIIKMKACP